MGRRPSRRRWTLCVLVAAGCVALPLTVAAQGLTGSLIGTVSDQQGLAIEGALVRISSPELIGGPKTATTDAQGQVRFLGLPPGFYVINIEKPGFATSREADIYIGAGDRIQLHHILKVGRVETVLVEVSGSGINERGVGFLTRFGPDILSANPMRRLSPYEWPKNAPGISPTSPAGGSMLMSAAGSGVDQNQFQVDGTNVTAPTNGTGRSDPGVDFIQEVQIQTVGVSVEYGNVQGAVVNIITRSGSNRFLFDASYYAQPSRLTSQPIRAGPNQTGFERVKYRDITTTLGGPVMRDRLWFFAGYQHLRDYDSQPGSDPGYPRTYEQDKVLAKITWRLAPNWLLVQSFSSESLFNPQVPTSSRPIEATQFVHGWVPAINFGHLTHTASANTVWEVRVGRLFFSSETSPPSGDWDIPNRVDQPGNRWSGAPQQVGQVKHSRTTAKVTVTHYWPRRFGAGHEWKLGAQVDGGEHRGLMVIPTGEWSVYENNVVIQTTQQDPTHSGGQFLTAGAFVSDTVRVGDQVTISAGLRFDHSRAISQDMHRLDERGNDTGQIIDGKGTVDTWNTMSPRLGVIVRLDSTGRTLLRGSYGRFSQGVLTGEISPFHPGQTTRTITTFLTGDVTGVTIVDPKELQLDPDLRMPYTDQYSIGIDREIGGRLAISAAYIRKDGHDFIGWEDVGGVYREEQVRLPDGRDLQVFKLTNAPGDRRYRLTNPDGYLLTYDGLLIAVEKRRSNGWQAFGSYTLSKAYGLQPSSGTTADGAQVATIGSPPAAFASPVTFGRDPNDLTNARGRLPNDRPHMFRMMISADVPRTGFVLAANLQYLSGKPWAATARRVNPQDPERRILLEQRGTQRLSSQTLLDVRVSRAFRLGDLVRVELRLDVLNALNDTAEESIKTDDYFSAADFGVGNIFMDPRRAMFSVKLNLGR